MRVFYILLDEDEAALAAFLKIMNDKSLNAQKIHFVCKIVYCVEKNG